MGFACVHHHLAQNSFFTALNVLGSTYLSLPLPPKALTNIYLFTVSFTAPFPELHRAGIIQLLLLRCSVLSDILQPQELQHARVPCPSPSPRVYSNSSQLSWRCHPTISSSVVLFSFYLQIFPSIRVSSTASVFCIRWPKYWSFSFSISPPNEYSGLISFRIDWFDLFAVQGTLKSLFQYHSLKVSILGHSAIFVA